MMEWINYAGNDWFVFMEATRLFLLGGDPYSVQLRNNIWLKVMEPPWTYALLSPFTLLPNNVARDIYFVFGFCVFAYSSIRLGAKPWQMAMLLLSLPVIGGQIEGNVDWLVTAGFWMPPQIGLFFVLMKPQIGIGLAGFWAYKAWKKGRLFGVWETFSPVICAYALSFVAYGFWISSAFNMYNNPVNVSLFPWELVIAIPLFAYAIEHDEQNVAAISSPLFAPYITLFNMSGVLLSLFNRPKLFITIWIMLWLPTIVGVLMP